MKDVTELLLGPATTKILDVLNEEDITLNDGLIVLALIIGTTVAHEGSPFSKCEGLIPVMREIYLATQEARARHAN